MFILKKKIMLHLHYNFITDVVKTSFKYLYLEDLHLIK